jgi:SH3-like domain-containing protein
MRTPVSPGRLSHAVRVATKARFGRLGALLVLVCWAVLSPRIAAAQEIGSVTKLPLPRYVSLKSDKVNLREGPSRDHRAIWIFQRAGLPVEITAEFDTWRKIRDSEGSEGWVLHSLLSGRRTALVAPWKKGQTFNLFSSRNDQSPPIAGLQAGVIGNIQTCDRTWCRIYGEGFDGYVPQTNLWGVYPNETIP